MKLRCALLFGFLGVVTSQSAYAETTWTCSWPGYLDPSKPVISKFKVLNGELVDDELKQRYKILQDNERGLVAAWSISEMEPNHQRPSIGAFLIVIDKDTHEFKRVTVTAGENNYSPSTGTCILN